MLLLTQPGFPYGRSEIPSTAPGTVPPQYTNLASLTDLYSQFANSDEVKRLMHQEGAPKTWTISALPAVPTIQGGNLPVIVLSGHANSASASVSAVVYGRQALNEYVQRQQQLAKIPHNQRITLQIVQAATEPAVFAPRKKTLPIVVFLAVTILTIGLAFILENLRPRVRAVTPAEPAFRANTKQSA